MNNATLQAPQAFSAAIDPTTAWTLLVVVAVLSTLVGVVFIVAIVWTCMVCSGQTDVVSHEWCNGRGDYGRRPRARFPPTHREMVEMGHIPSTNTMLRHHHPAISQDSGVSRELGLRLSCHPDQVPNVPAPRSWTPSPPYELTKPYSRSRLGMKSKSQAQMQPIFGNKEEDVNFCHSLPAQQMTSCPRCSHGGQPQEMAGAAKAPCCTSRSPFNPRQNSPASDAWSRGSIMRSPCEEGGIDNPMFEHSPNCHEASSVQHHHQHTKKDLIDRLNEQLSPHYASASAMISPHVQDQTKQKEEASKMQFGQYLEIPRKPMQRHRSRMFLQQPGSAESNNAGNYIFTNDKNLDDTMDILLRHENQGPVACSSRQTTPTKKPEQQIYDANALSDFSGSRSDPLVFQKKHYNTPNTPNNSLSGSLKDPMEPLTHFRSPGPRQEVFTDPVSRHHKTKAFHPTPYDVKRGASNRHMSRFKSQQVIRTPYAYQRALSDIQLPPSSEGIVSGQDIYVGSQNVQDVSQRNRMQWSGDLKLCMSCSTQGTLHKNQLNGKERATQTCWSNNSTINNTQEMDPTPSMSWDHLTPDPSLVLGAQDLSDDEDAENYEQVLNDTTHIVGNSSKVFDDTDHVFDTSPQCKGNLSGVTVNSSHSRNISSQTDPDSSQAPQMSFRRNSTQIQPSISELRDMSSAVSPMVRGSPFIFVDSRITVDSPQFVVDSSQLRVESPYHITDTPLSPFSESKSYGTTSIALRLAHSPLGKKFPLFLPEPSRNSSTSTVKQNETLKNSGTYLLQSPAHFSRSNKQRSGNHSQNNDLHADSKGSPRLTPTHCLQTTSSKKSPEKIQTSSPSSGNNNSNGDPICEVAMSLDKERKKSNTRTCNTYRCEYDSSPEVINADTLETLLPDDDNYQNINQIQDK